MILAEIVFLSTFAACYAEKIYNKPGITAFA
jgi:hypothetical protein